jgi:hypothetical protein
VVLSGLLAEIVVECSHTKKGFLPFDHDRGWGKGKLDQTSEILVEILVEFFSSPALLRPKVTFTL